MVKPHAEKGSKGVGKNIGCQNLGSVVFMSCNNASQNKLVLNPMPYPNQLTKEN